MQNEKNGMFGNFANVDYWTTDCIYLEAAYGSGTTEIINRPAMQAFYFAFKPACMLHTIDHTPVYVPEHYSLI